MKLFTISEYKKDPSKLSSRLKPDEPLSIKHEVISGNRLLVEHPFNPTIYTEADAAEWFVLRTQYKELKCRPIRNCRTKQQFVVLEEYFDAYEKDPCYEFAGPEQTVLVED